MGVSRGGRRGLGSRLFRLCGALFVLGLVAAALLWLITPSVGDAWDRLHTLTTQNHSAQLNEPVPPKFEAALVATEDSRFYRHHGIDSIGVVRGGVGFVTGNETGGSTLNQQLAKNLYFDGQHPMWLAPAQMTVALKLDRAYSKADILQMYADISYFGHGFYGLRDAACGYFGLTPDELTWSQASLLAGLVQAPTNYDPLEHPDLAAKRQEHVLDRLVATGAITEEQKQAITPATWDLNPGTRCR
ncbi:biosynthetic peptidoglycan transglycosylase [Smaragdicoccus niigatensis]|uniref:biosynthetic peptidoglycan transglycosylase n=1 Tax=Smaragdicoccus niigatensis TaxID=359359 RepID=UPI00039E67FD|nr:biosynthetic peptidoglycan transglycosylase [Smaragdicoccus niigatensis]